MAAFLSDGWLDEMEAAARAVTLDPEARLVVQQVVRAVPSVGEVAYVVRAAEGALTVQPGRADDADVTFTQDHGTALAIHRGELSAQEAFLEGRVRLSGDHQALLDQIGALAAIGDVFAGARA